MIWHSHGWGGSRTTDPAAFATFLDGGYGVLSFDQRGFGESGGHAYVENPAVEGKDVARLIRVMSRLPWVRQDGPGDPRLGAIGGSYGGGYQFLAAFTSLERRGTPVLDAMAPEITWHDLNESLAPEGVVRTEWAAALSAASLPTDALPPRVYKALVEGAATGTWPDGSIPGTEDMPEFFAPQRSGLPRRRRAAGSTSRCSSARARPTASSRSSRGWPTGSGRSPPRPAGTASSSPTTAATCCPACCPAASR